MKAFSVAAFLGLLLAAPDKQDDLTQRLSARTAAGRVEGSFVEALGQTARVFNIPMGISWLNTESAQQKRTIEYENTTVLEVIEQIANTEPGYEVTAANGVVHVSTMRVPPGQNFLYLRIPNFSAGGSSGLVQAALRMRLNQEISPDPRRGYGGSIFSSVDDPKLDLHMANVSVEDILDNVAVASNDKVWVVTFEEKPDHLTATGFRRTEFVRSKTFVPDEAQPVWICFAGNGWPCPHDSSIIRSLVLRKRHFLTLAHLAEGSGRAARSRETRAVGDSPSDGQFPEATLT